jgi:shikimate kinase
MTVRAVFLVGFMAAGKTSVGQELARRLNWDFVDLDLLIESREQQTIPEIFRTRGESAFRLAETTALRDLTASFKRHSVVALGGGTFAHPANFELLQPWPSVFLDAPVEELWQRSMENPAQRPLRNHHDEFMRLHQLRLPVYRKATVTVVTSGNTPASLCAEIERILQLVGTTPAGPQSAGTESAGSSQLSHVRPRTGEPQ